MSIKGLILVICITVTVLAGWLGHHSWVLVAEAAANLLAAAMCLAGIW